MLTLQAVTKIKSELEGAFKPLHCIAQVYDTGQKLRFKVFDRDYDTACEMADLSLRALFDQNLLSDACLSGLRPKLLYIDEWRPGHHEAI